MLNYIRVLEWQRGTRWCLAEFWTDKEEWDGSLHVGWVGESKLIKTVVVYDNDTQDWSSRDYNLVE